MLTTDRGKLARFSPPEELIIRKLQWFALGATDRQLTDITGMLGASGASIDRARVAELAAEAGVAHIWEAVLKRIGDA